MIEDFSDTDYWKLLVVANRYLIAADVLKRSEEYHASRALFTPVLHLTAHGIEVLLKANLVGGGIALNDVRKYGHNISALWAHELNLLLRETAVLEAGKIWQQALATGEWQDQFSEDPTKLLEEYIEAISILHTSSSEYALRYIAEPGMIGPRPHLLVDTFLEISDLCVRHASTLAR